MHRKQGFKRVFGVLLSVGLLSAALAAETSAASRYDNQLQTAVTQKLASKNQYSNVKATVEDGIVTLTGTVDLYQRKLDAAKLARKIPNAQGVRNLITVAGANVADERLEQKLATKLTYVREGYDSTFKEILRALYRSVLELQSLPEFSQFGDGLRQHVLAETELTSWRNRARVYVSTGAQSDARREDRFPDTRLEPRRRAAPTNQSETGALPNCASIHTQASPRWTRRNYGFSEFGAIDP